MRSFVFWFSFHFLDKFIQNSGGVVAENAALLISTSSVVGGGGSGIGLVPIIAASVVCLHAIGFFVGYIIPRKVLRFDARVSRTISIETGMQNSALAVVLARSIGAPSIASLPVSSLLFGLVWFNFSGLCF